MPDITLRSSRFDDSFHAFKGGSCIASGAYKGVLHDALLACGPGEKVVRGSSIAMRFPPTPAAVKKAHAAAAPKAAPKKAAPKKAAPKKAAPKKAAPKKAAQKKSKSKAPGASER